MIHLIIGILCASLFFGLFLLGERMNRNFSILKIIALLTEIVFIAFVIELVLGFMLEGTYKGAILMGLLFGFPCIVAGLIIFRWIFTKPLKTQSDETD